MFGFGKVQGLSRLDYYAAAKEIIEHRFGIETDKHENELFLDNLSFDRALFQGWYERQTVEEIALGIGLFYWECCARAGWEGDPESRDRPLQEARRIERSLLDFISQAGLSGKVSASRCQEFIRFHTEHHWRIYTSEDYVRDHGEQNVITKCPDCSQSVRVPAGKTLRIKCPRCESEWVEKS